MKKKYFIDNPLFRILAPVVYGVIVYLLILLINNSLNQLNDIFIGQEVYLCIGLTFLSFESTRLIIIAVNRYLPESWKSRAIPIQLVTSVVASLTLVILCLTLYFDWVIGFSMASSQLKIFAVIYAFTTVLYNILYYSNYYLNQENTLKLSAEKQQQEVLELEISEFKNDINPDLLYESLESTIGLMYHDPEKAEAYIDSLAATYRYALTNRHTEFISVQTEIQAAQDVITLLNEQHFGLLRLQVHPQVSTENRLLIPGSLPLAVESLVRNTIITPIEPLVIVCYLEDDEYLVLQCKLNDRLLQHDESMKSLKRLQKSYALYSDKPMIQVKAYAENYIKFPVVTVSEEVHPL
jgi:sensor histidine kinase YesM